MKKMEHNNNISTKIVEMSLCPYIIIIYSLLGKYYHASVHNAHNNSILIPVLRHVVTGHNFLVHNCFHIGKDLRGSMKF